MKILITGDFCPQHRLREAIHLNKPVQVFGEFISIVKDVDIAITNLECPLTDSKEAIIKTGPALKAPEETAGFLKKAGFNLLTLANNHIMDFGSKGLFDTIENLNAQRLPFIGAGKNKEEANRAYYIEHEGIKVAFLNFAENEWSTTHAEHPGANPIDAVSNFRVIQEAKRKVDQVVVITHGGHEMYRLPSPRMKQLFRFYVEAGANAVINHHTHCTSGFEVYQGAPIFYSLGNFLFDHPKYTNKIWNKGMAVLLNISIGHCLFEIIHFDQCNDRPEISLCVADENANRNQELDQLNKIIQTDTSLKAAFEDLVLSQTKLFRSYIEPHHNRYIQALQNRRLLPSMWTKRKKQYLLNLLRCESHRDILQVLLEDENCHSKQ